MPPKKTGKSPVKEQKEKFEQTIRELKEQLTQLSSELDKEKESRVARDNEIRQNEHEFLQKENELEQVISQKDIELAELETACRKKDAKFDKELSAISEDTQRLKEVLAREEEANKSLNKDLQESQEQISKLEELKCKQSKTCEELENKIRQIRPRQTDKSNGDNNDDLNSSFSSSSSAKVNMTIPRIDKFEGTNWEGFISQFTSLAEYFEWSTRDQLFQLLHHVAGDARQFVFMKCDNSVRSSYKALETALKQRFGNGENRSSFLSQLEALKFGPKDSLAEFCTDIAFLVRKAWPNVDDKTRQEMEVEYFIKNLGDLGMIRTVGNQAPDNLEEARQLAETYMRLEDQMKPRRNVVRKVTFQDQEPEQYVTENRLNRFGDDLVRQIEKRLAKLADSLKPNSGPPQPRVCHHCKRQGHFVRSCPELNRQIQHPPRGRGPWQQWQNGPHHGNNDRSFPPPHSNSQATNGMRGAMAHGNAHQQGN